MKNNVTAIILHFGSWNITKDCLDSLSKINTKNINLSVFLVDNSTSKNAQINPIITQTISPSKNLGFAAGNNLAIKISKTLKPNYYLFLNNDTIVEPHFLQNLINNLPQKDCIAGPVIEHKVNGKTFYDYGGSINWQKTQPKHTNLTTHTPTQKPIQRNFISGCCMLVSKNIIDNIGTFRQDYFMYLEDVELCLRAKKYQFQTYLIPQSKIFHKGSQSSTEFTKIFYSWKNSLKLTLEYTPKKYLASSFFFNFLFYPALYLRWQAMHLYHFLKQLGLSSSTKLKIPK
jgi:GT2 family glycosyltransferase